jgi:hypothetical protein
VDFLPEGGEDSPLRRLQAKRFTLGDRAGGGSPGQQGKLCTFQNI